MKSYDKFPEGFFFGTATSAHQVEGGNTNDWSHWEQKNAKKLSDAAKKNFQKWDEQAIESQNEKNYISKRACDHFNLFEEDIYLMQKLGFNAYRFSLEWSRIEPEEGKFDREALDHYRKMVRVLKTYNIEPFVTLWHWTLPAWFAQTGGFKNQKSPNYFARFAKVVAKSLGRDVKYLITLNEPEIYALNSYYRGIWPPQAKNPLAALKVFHNLIKAHRKAYKIIKKISPEVQVGIAKNNTYFEAYKNKPVSRTLKKLVDRYWNEYFLDKIADRQDFIGLNYYFHNRIDGWFNHNENRAVSDLGWELYPRGIYYVLRNLKKYRKPVIITENGLADVADKYRAPFIEKTLKSVSLAIKNGVDVRGYLHWSFMDNFEWDKGFWPKFGLVEVDFETLERTPRPSALYYSELIKKLTK